MQPPGAHPDQLLHRPLLHWLSWVHQHVAPTVVHEPLGSHVPTVAPPTAHVSAEHIGMPGSPSWQCMASQLVPVPVHGP